MKKGKSATKPVPRPQNVVQYCTVYLYIHCAKYPVPFFSLKLMAGLKVAHTVCAIYYVILWYNMNIPQLGCYCVLIYYSELIITSAFGLGDYLAPRSILEHNSTLVVEYSYIIPQWITIFGIISKNYCNQQQNQFPDRRMLSNILQLITSSNNRIEGMTHCLCNLLSYTVVLYEFSTTRVLLCSNILLGANNHLGLWPRRLFSSS